jgi:DNA-binding response OmpR family regulator
VPEKPSLSPASARILLIEDDPHLGAQMDTQLRGAGYSIRWLRDGAEAPDIDERFDLVLLDLMLPTSYGLDVLKDLRVRSEVPVIIVTARGDPAEKVRSFQLGADDYVTKPFWPEELLARVRARLRRPRLERADELVVGDLCIEPAERRVRLRGEVIPCTPAEFEILVALCRRAGTAISRTWLVDHALDREHDGDEQRTLDVHVSRLRRKLGKECIETVWGIGYRVPLPSSHR